MKRAGKLPVILITGFLGSGKTTFLNRILKQPEFRDSLVIVNEFGAVPVDHLLVEQAAETVFELSNGCVCCSVRNDLVETLLETDTDRFQRVFIETTGIADPLPVFQALVTDQRLVQNFHPAGILTVVDAIRGADLLKEHAEAGRQVAVADRVIITKTDLASDIRDLSKALATLNPVVKPDSSALNLRPEDFQVQTAGSKPLADNTENHADYRSMVLESDRRLSTSDLVGMLNIISNRLGRSLLRIKGFALVRESEQPVLVQVSGSIIHDLEPASSPALPNETRLVVITSGGYSETAKSVFDGFVGRPSPGTPDRNALLENPLSIPGTGK